MVEGLIANLKGIFQSGPLQELAEKIGEMMKDESAELEQLGTVETTDDFRKLFEKHRHLNVKQRDSFLFALLVMADYVYSADQTADAIEKKFIRKFLRENFDRYGEMQGMCIMRLLGVERKRLSKTNRMLYIHMVGEYGRQLTNIMTYAQRMQLLSFLVMIAKVSEGISEAESAALKDLAIYLKMRPEDLYSMLNLYDDSLKAAYKVLGTCEEASEKELQLAFEYMSEQYNPERMCVMGEDLERMARMKYVKILEARDRIWQARGMVLSADRLLEWQ